MLAQPKLGRVQILGAGAGAGVCVCLVKNTGHYCAGMSQRFRTSLVASHRDRDVRLPAMAMASRPVLPPSNAKHENALIYGFRSSRFRPLLPSPPSPPLPSPPSTLPLSAADSADASYLQSASYSTLPYHAELRTETRRDPPRSWHSAGRSGPLEHITSGCIECGAGILVTDRAASFSASLL